MTWFFLIIIIIIIIISLFGKQFFSNGFNLACIFTQGKAKSFLTSQSSKQTHSKA